MSGKILEGPREDRVYLKTIGESIFESADKHRENICQIDAHTGIEETYGSVKKRSVRVAIELQKKGVTPDDVVVICSFNTLDNGIPVLATLYLGAKVASFDPTLTARQTKHLLTLTTSKIIFVQEASVNLIEESLEGLMFTPEIIVFGSSKKYRSFSDLQKENRDEDIFKPVHVNLDETAIMFFSSGTTGLPKAICHTNKSVLMMHRQYPVSNTVLYFTTFYWYSGTVMYLTSFLNGDCRIICREVDPELVFRAIEKYKINLIFLAPIFTYKLTNFQNADKYDTSSLMAFATGGTALSPTQKQKLESTFKSCYVFDGYGQTEVGALTMFNPFIDAELTKIKPTSCGKPMFNVKMKIVDPETNEILPPNRKGEIRVITSTMMKGYLKQDNSIYYDEDGFFKTGDVGYYDEDGCIYVVDRIKEMFKYQTWHIVPTVLENIIYEHPDVEEVAVFGLPRGEEGEVPAAHVILRKGSSVTEKEIEDFVAERVVDKERLRGGVKFVSSLPKTPTGKIIRNEVKKIALKSSL